MKPIHVIAMFRLFLLGVVGLAAIDALGLMHGTGATAALWLLMPEQRV